MTLSEIPIGQENFEKTAKVFSNLNLGDFMHSFQKRHNFLYKGVELALKWSEIWKHHLELEIVINNSIDKNKAEKDILAIAEELGVKIMTDKELKEFTEKAEADYKRHIKMEIINHLKLNKERTPPSKKPGSCGAECF